ncbi:hypothetical protein LOTGIDRAFT_153716 [Lottia gigantea]|uniref:Uncharacterized protein n=1 Tax=Lottia gigantea TaxID=225164 RepID=V4AD77_LOTGI|nr:hypothetical protein LOTGIDRAFT_153716 [Lottia gigantea]ESO91286.1 hypothetical protein LOTGIDRAFT_153716 [Lottia gigantea]
MPSRSARTINWRRLFTTITPNSQRSGPEINRFRMTENEKMASFSVYSSPSLRTSDVQHDLIGELRKLSTSTAGKYDVSYASSREKCVRMACFVIMWLPILLVSGAVMYVSVLHISNEKNIDQIRTGLKNLNMTLGLSTILSSEMTLIITYSHGQNSEGTQSLTDTFLRTEYYLKDHQDWPYQLCTQWKVMKTKYSLLNYLRNYRLFSKGKEAWKNSAIFHSIEQELSLCSMNFLTEGDGLIPWFNMAVIADILAFHIRLQFHISRLTYCSEQHINDQFEMRSHLELANFFISKSRNSVTIPFACSELIAFKKLEHSHIDFCSQKHMEFEKQRLQLANECFFALSSDMEVEVIRTTDILLRWILVEVFTLILSLLISAPTLYLVVSKHTKYLQMCEQYVLRIGRQLSQVRGRMSSVLEEVLPRQCPKMLSDATTTSKYYQNVAVLVVDIRHIWRNIPTAQPDKMIGIYNVVLNLLDNRIAQYDVHFVQRTDFFYTILSGE